MRVREKVVYFLFGVFSILLILLLLFVYNNIFKKKNEVSVQEKYTCTFVRTYKVEYILPSNSDRYLYLTVRAFQDEEVQTIKISKSLCPQIEQGRYYEFKFRPLNKIQKDTILNIYQNSTIISIENTEKVGLEQVQDRICES